MKISNIRILHITNNLEYGGVQKIIFQLCNGTKDSFDKVIVASTGGVYVQRLKEIGIDHFQIPDVSSKNPKDVIQIIRTLDRLIKKYNINIIHCHHRMAVLFAKFFSGKVKIIYNNHTIYSDKPLLTHFVLSGIDIIADGVQAKKNVTDYFGIPDENVTIINNAVDEYDGEYSEIPEIAQRKKRGDFIVLNSARLHPQKGMNYYIDAARILIDKGYNISFFIVGDGQLRGEIEKQIEELCLGNYVTLLGFRKDIKNVIKQADVLVLTSVYEGLPLTPMEAFSVSRAAIGTDIAGTREVISDGVNGLLAETKNPVSIAAQIERLYLDRELLSKLDANAYKTFIEEFSSKPFIERYNHFYEGL